MSDPKTSPDRLQADVAKSEGEDPDSSRKIKRWLNLADQLLNSQELEPESAEEPDSSIA